MRLLREPFLLATEIGPRPMTESMGLEKKPCAFGVRCSAAHKEAHNLLTMSLSPAIDPCLCPLCGQPNSCAMACAPHPEAPDATSQPAQAEPCWCTRVQFSAHVLQQVPEAAKNKACICQRCATAAATAPTALTSIVKD